MYTSLKSKCDVFHVLLCKDCKEYSRETTNNRTKKLLTLINSGHDKA